MVTGAQGQVGRHLTDLFGNKGFEVIALNHNLLDITSKEEVFKKVSLVNPDVLINAAAYTAVEKAEDEEMLAYNINCLGAKYLALAAKNANARFFHLSTDYVFDGEKETPYVETDCPNPKTSYGRTKLAGEQAVLAVNPESLVLRVSWVFSQYGNNFIKTILRLAREKDELRIVNDQYGGPTWAGHIAEVLLSLIDKTSANNIHGIYHFSGQPYCSWYEFAQFFVEKASFIDPLIKKERLYPVPSSSYPVKVFRPKNSRLKSMHSDLLLSDDDFSWCKGVDEVLKKIIE